MKKIDTSSWKLSPDEHECVLFFVERVRELVFDYTSYHHKSNGLSIRSLCHECLLSVSRQETNPYDQFKGEFKELVNELRSRTHSDLVAKSLLEPKLQLYLDALEPTATLEYLSTTLNLILLKITSLNYLGRTRKLLTSFLKSPKEKQKLNFLAENFVTCLLESGYEQSTIYHLLQVYFSDRTKTNTIDSIDKAIAFLDYFDLTESKYEVIFYCSSLFLGMKDSCEIFNIEVLTNLPIKLNQPIEEHFAKRAKNKRIFLKCSKIKAVDYQAARREAETRIRLVSDLFVVFHHKRRPFWSGAALVYHTVKNEVICSEKPVPVMAKVKDIDQMDAGGKQAELIKNFVLEPESFTKFHRAVELHSSALQSEELETQLLDLWIIFETLFVTDPKKSKIEQVIESVAPFFRVNIVPYLIGDILEALLEWNKPLVREMFSELPGECTISDHHAIAALIAIKSFEPKVNKLFDEMGNHPLLRFKLFQLITCLQRANKVREMLDQHQMKLVVDLRRIYRIRNQIVHVGKVPSELQHIVEAAHTYLDNIFTTLIVMNISQKQIGSIKQAIRELSFCVRGHDQYLEANKEDSCTAENYIHMLFGFYLQ